MIYAGENGAVLSSTKLLGLHLFLPMFLLCSGVSTGASGGVYCGDSVIRSMAGKSL